MICFLNLTKIQRFSSFTIVTLLIYSLIHKIRKVLNLLYRYLIFQFQHLCLDHKNYYKFIKLMITPFTARKIKKLEKKQSNNSDIFDYHVQGNNKIFCYPIPVSYSPAKTTRQNEKHKKQRKQSFSTSYPKQPFVNFSHTTRGHQVWQKQRKLGQKTYQIIVRQSLRRTQTSRSDNHSRSPNQNMVKSSRHLSDFSERDQEQEFFYELEGKKCAISNLNKNRTSQSQEKAKNISDTGSSIKNNLKKQKQLATLVNQNVDQFSPRQAVMKTHKVSGLNTLNSSQRSQQNKIAISTTKCLILSENIIENKSCQPGLYIEAQTNFIRAKKKSSGLAKKVAKLQRQVEQTQIKITESRVSSFRDAINKNPKLSIRNNSAQEKNKPSISMSGPIRKKEECIRIDGWEMSGNEQIEAAF